jgi:hypothetical protein
MTEPQVWTLIGVFAAAIFGVITLMSTLFVRIIRVEIGSVRSEMGSVRAEIGSLRSELTVRFDYLDRDVQALSKRVFGDQS